MANEFIARKGLIVPSGSIIVTSGSVTALNFIGTASAAISSSNALTASFALNAAGSGFPFSGSAVITGSLNVTQGVTASYFKGDGSQLTNLPASQANSALRIDNHLYEADGVTTDYILSQSYYTADSIVVSVGGIAYAPIFDYTVSSSTLSFLEAPPSSSNIIARAFVAISSGSINTLSGSFVGNLTGTATSASHAITASYALNAQSGGSGAGFPYSGSAIITGSLEVIPTGNFNGITGSFKGDGAGLTNLRTSLAIDNHKFIGNGSTQNYTLSSSYDPISLVVTVGGLRYINDNDYTVSSNTIQFTQAPASESIILVQALLSVSSGSTGTFSGSFLGIATSASFATTASFASNVLKTKAGAIAYTSFGGTPLTASVTFSTSFPNTNFAVVVTGEDARIWTIESKTAGGFTVNSNSNTALTGTTYWTCTAYGEN